MLSIDQVKASMESLCDQALAICRDHEREKHDGEVCVSTRMALVQIFADRLGFRLDFDLGSIKEAEDE